MAPNDASSSGKDVCSGCGGAASCIRTPVEPLFRGLCVDCASCGLLWKGPVFVCEKIFRLFLCLSTPLPARTFATRTTCNVLITLTISRHHDNTAAHMCTLNFHFSVLFCIPVSPFHAGAASGSKEQLKYIASHNNRLRGCGSSRYAMSIALVRHL